MDKKKAMEILGAEISAGRSLAGVQQGKPGVMEEFKNLLWQDDIPADVFIPPGKG